MKTSFKGDDKNAPQDIVKSGIIPIDSKQAKSFVNGLFKSMGDFLAKIIKSFRPKKVTTITYRRYADGSEQLDISEKEY